MTKGFKLGGNEASAGPTLSYSRAWGGTESTMDTSTDQISVTAQRSITINPKAQSCYELAGSVARGSQQATVNANAAFTEYVGIQTFKGTT